MKNWIMLGASTAILCVSVWISRDKVFGEQPSQSSLLPNESCPTSTNTSPKAELPSAVTRQHATATGSEIADKRKEGQFASIRNPVDTSTSKKSDEKGPQSGSNYGDVPNAPWLGQVQSRIFELSTLPNAPRGISVQQVNCQGKSCEVSGVFAPNTSRPSMGVSDFMKQLSDSEVAGEGSGRQVAISSIRTTPFGTEFAMTVQENPTDFAPPPCEAIVEAWKTAWRTRHPEDFAPVRNVQR